MSRPRLASVSAAVTYGLYAAGWRLVRLLPEAVAYRLFDVVADVAWRRRGKGVRRLEANLARVRPELDDAGLQALSRAGMRSYLRYWCDSFRLPDWPHERIRSTVRVEGDEPVREALASGRGVVMFLGHLGNWDHAGAWSTLSLAPVTTVAERLRPERLFDRFVRFRERLGMTIIPLTGGSDVFRTLLRTLRDGGFVPLLADRDLTQGGVEVQLFGEPARMAVGPGGARAADRRRAVRRRHLLRAASGRAATASSSGGRSPSTPRTSAPGAQAVAALTQRCADHLAEVIAEHPEDWHMLQRVFVADLDPAAPPDRWCAMRIGLVCPYSFDVPGGVQFHVRDLAEHLLALGHDVGVLAPADDDTPVPPYLTSAGRSVAVPYNGAVGRLVFGPVSARRTRKWVEAGQFDVLHVHEPIVPSVSLLALWAYDGPVVATFHTSNLRSRLMQSGYPLLRPSLEKIVARIAVSEDARRTVTTHLGGDAVVIPNGVDVDVFAAADTRPEWTGSAERPTIAFVGRIDEPRKGLPVLCEAVPLLLERHAGCAGARGGAWVARRTRASCCPTTPRTPSPSSGWSATTTRPRCCGPSTCTSPRTRARRASASCWSRR